MHLFRWSDMVKQCCESAQLGSFWLLVASSLRSHMQTGQPTQTRPVHALNRNVSNMIALLPRIHWSAPQLRQETHSALTSARNY